MSLQYLSRSSLRRLAGLPCRFFFPSGHTRGPSVVFEAVDVLCPGPFHFSHIADKSISFILSLTQILVFLSLYVMLSILLSILVCASASLFCVCLVSVQVSAHHWPDRNCGRINYDGTESGIPLSTSSFGMVSNCVIPCTVPGRLKA